MTKSELYDLTTELLDGIQLGDTLFDALLDIAQSNRENMRPWMALRTVDTSITISTNNTFLTAKTLPTNFRKWYARSPIILVDASGNAQAYLTEIGIEARNAYRLDNSRFYTDYAAKQAYICGSPAQSLTANLFYIKRATKVSSGDTVTWELDPNDEFTKILAYDVAAMHKLGIDYDIINAAQGNANAATASLIFRQMEEWDTDLQNSALQGRTYGTEGSQWEGNASGGRMSS